MQMKNMFKVVLGVAALFSVACAHQQDKAGSCCEGKNACVGHADAHSGTHADAHAHADAPVAKADAAVAKSEMTADAVEKVQLTDNLSGSHFKDIYFSKQPALNDFEALKKQGFTHVINLRDPSEHDEQAEQDKLKTLGIQYTNIPFKSADELSDAYIASVTQAVMAHRKEGKTLVHCSSGNRVAVWVGGHFYKDHHFSKEASVQTAEAAGLTKAPAKAKLQAYLADKP